MNIQPQPPSTQLQQHQLSNNTSDIGNKADCLTINSGGVESVTSSNISTASNFKNIPSGQQPQQGNTFYSIAANNNNNNVNNNNNNATYFIQAHSQSNNANNFVAQSSGAMVVKQPLQQQQQQQYQQFANQNNNDMQQQQFQNSNLKYYMTSSPVSIGKILRVHGHQRKFRNRNP